MTQTPNPSDTTLQAYPADKGAVLDLSEQTRLGELSLEISIALARHEALRDMLTSCTEALVSYLGAAFARIWILNEEEGILELQASSGMYTHLNGAHARVPVGALKIGLIAAERKPHLTNAVLGDPRVADQEWARREGMVAFAGYPLLVEERLIGVVAMFARHPLNDATLQSMAAIANGIAVGVERVRLLVREQDARLEAENARQHLHDLLMQAPAIISVLRGRSHIFELANQGYLQLFAQRDLIGKSIREALPELEGQGLFELLDQVYTTGQPFVGQEIKMMLDRHSSGALEEGYFNFVYQPTHSARGKVNGILVHGVEVTEQVQARERLKTSQERLTLSQQIGRVGTFEWDVHGNRLLWTPELEVLYGLAPGGSEGDYQNWARRVHPDDVKRTEEQMRAAVENGSPYNIEYRVVWPDGSVHWLLVKGEITYEDGQPSRMIGVNIDITERKETEQQLAALNQDLQELNATLEARVEQRTEALGQLNTELQRSNQELQDFAYVASHDLQEPLRKIQSFGNLLQDEYGEELGEGRAYLDRMRNAATRMRILIEDLLAFSRVATRAQPFTRVDLGETVRQVVDDLEARLESTEGEITVGDLPTIDADARQMYQLFQNLIANALKFHRRDVAPVVKVSAELFTDATESPSSAQQRCRILVEDNGIGFDEKYLDRIFTVFQRLHGKEEYEGTGIGLAVVRKIAERHGGSITARSKVGEGTTFIVTMPVMQQNINRGATE